MGAGPVCSIQLGTSTIFRGTVVESVLISDIRTFKKPDGTEIKLSGNGTYKVRLQVAETSSGKPEAEQTVYTAQQGSACGFPFQVGPELEQCLNHLGQGDTLMVWRLDRLGVHSAT